MTDREITQDDIESAQRGLNMLGKSPRELLGIIADHQRNTAFASRVIYRAACQMHSAKLRAGAEVG